MRQLWPGLVLGVVAALAAVRAHALPPDQVFERAAPNLWALRLIGPDNQSSALGSAVAIAAGKAVTSCSLLPQGGRFALQREKSFVPARLEFSDAARDLCLLDATGLQVQEPARGVARIGQRVYAIGYERGVEITISEGLISRLRDAGTDAERVQSSVPTSGWLLGGGLYDDEARLLGIVTMALRDASGVVVAVPARWITEIAGRARAAPAGAASAGSGGILPAPGASWNYAYTFRGLGAARYNLTVRVDKVGSGVVQESVALAGNPASPATTGLESLNFRTFPLPRSQTLVEFAPYLHVLLAKNESILWGKIAGYPVGNAAMPFWTLSASKQGEEQVAVPAGTFKATKIEVWGKRQAPPGFLAHMSYESTRFRYRAWYAPEVRRYVKLQHETWSLNGQWSGEQVVELLSYSDK